MVRLLRFQHLVQGVDADGTARILPDAALVIAAGRIEAVGPAADLLARYPGIEPTRFARGTAIPGLVNAHHHVGVTPFQLGVPDLPLEPWIVRRMAGAHVPPYLDTLYSAFEMIESGITTVQHLYANRSATPETMLAEGAEIIRAYRDIGMRVSLGIMFFDQNPLSYTGPAFDQGLTEAEGAAVSSFRDHGNMSLAAHLEVVAELRRTTAGMDGVRIQLAPGNLHGCSHRALERLAEAASADSLAVHMHLLETPIQQAYADWRCDGKSPVAYLRDLGFTGPQVTLGHGVWLRSRDIAEFAESGFSVCHNCASNLRLSSGIAPARRLLSAGVNLALGIDEAGLNDDRDMLAEMRLALHLHKATDPNDPVGLQPGQLVRMATEAGAATTGFGARIGKLEPGRAADFFVFDSAAAAYPGLAELWSPLDLLCYRGKPQHILATYVAGEPIFSDGQHRRLDRGGVLAEIAAHLVQAGCPSAGQVATLMAVGRKLVAEHEAAAAAVTWFTR
jgi:cytosine/adenosine deaminase-related metal-dependent hydrolase